MVVKYTSYRAKIAVLCLLSAAFISVFMFLTQVYSHTFDADSLRLNLASKATLDAVGSNPHQLRIVHNIKRDHPHVHRILGYLKSTGLEVDSFDSAKLPAGVLDKMAFGEQALIAIWSEKLSDIEGFPQIRRLFIGSDVLVARQRLRRLDGSFRLRLHQFLDDKSIIGFTGSHGEHAWTGEKSKTDLRKYEYIKRSLRDSYRELVSLAKFIHKDTLKDIEAVISIDGRTGWFEQELKHMDAFLENGGKWFLCLDSARELQRSPLGAWLGQHNIQFSRFAMADESEHLSLGGTLRDRGFLMVQEYGGSPVARVLRRQPALTATVFSSPSLFSLKDKGALAAFPSPSAFEDKNGNFKKDADENLLGPAYGILLSKQIGKGKLLLAGDCGWLQDFLMGSTGNRLLWAGAESWLFNPEVSAFEPDTKDQFLLRTSKQAKSFLWLTTALVPFAVLWLGFVNLVWFRKP